MNFSFRVSRQKSWFEKVRTSAQHISRSYLSVELHYIPKQTIFVRASKWKQTNFNSYFIWRLFQLKQKFVIFIKIERNEIIVSKCLSKKSIAQWLVEWVIEVTENTSPIFSSCVLSFFPGKNSMKWSNLYVNLVNGDNPVSTITESNVLSGEGRLLRGTLC